MSKPHDVHMFLCHVFNGLTVELVDAKFIKQWEERRKSIYTIRYFGAGIAN